MSLSCAFFEMIGVILSLLGLYFLVWFGVGRGFGGVDCVGGWVEGLRYLNGG